MTKYEPLAGFLSAARGDHLPVNFRDLEEILGGKLPGSAYKYSAWWSNNPSNNRMTQVWLDAGWRTTQVDIPGQKLVFERTVENRLTNKAQPVQANAPIQRRSKEDVDRWWNRIYGALKHTMHIPDGVDLTQPTGERWKAQGD
jgi:hypothetical protein